MVKKAEVKKYVFPPSDTFSAEITAKQGDFTFFGLALIFIGKRSYAQLFRAVGHSGHHRVA